MQASGGTETTVGSDKVHTFSSSGTFTVYGSGTARVMVIGGGSSTTTGGGAGKYMYDAAYALTSGTYTVTVGGIAGTSIFGTITAGPGSGGTSGNGYGAGGGASGTYGSASGGGGGSAGNGGGASAPGDYVKGGNAGAGTSNDITGTAVTYACGGAGSLTGGGSFLSADDLGSQTYGQGAGDNSRPAIAGVVIIRYTNVSADSGLRFGDQKIAYETLNATHKIRFNKSGTVVGLPLVDTTSVVASSYRIYVGTTQSFVEVP